MNRTQQKTDNIAGHSITWMKVVLWEASPQFFIGKEMDESGYNQSDLLGEESTKIGISRNYQKI